jgi:hypothetical protein
MPWEALARMAFWSWSVFLGCADRLATDGWIMAYLVEPLPKKADPVHMLRLIGVVNLIRGAIVLGMFFA